ncbi:hypothetical protein Scep_024878 [Stephania cephalantha]|uniref:Uncharacterized protein n=1 Tax=Stephania cephalantha TaxID=152367 RepID=A0AAP0F2Q2_9MAGN
MATPTKPIDEEKLYYDAMGSAQSGRVYGLGSLAEKKRRYADPVLARPRTDGATFEFDALVRRLTHLRLSCRVNWECAWTLVRTPLVHHHHHRHHLGSIIAEVGMDPACSPQEERRR